MHRRGAKFVEKTLRQMLEAASYAAGAEDVAMRPGVLQGIDPKAKVAGFLGLIVAAASARRIEAPVVIFGAALLLAFASRVPAGRLAAWFWLPALLFTGTIALPSVFLAPHPPQFGIAGLLIARAETAVTLTALLVLTTPWPKVLRALRALGVPAAAVVILGMTCRYLFLMLRTAVDMLESRRSRTVGELPAAEGRRLAAASAGVLLSRSLKLSSEVHLAMLSRGFRGEVYLLDDRRARLLDWLWLAGFAGLAASVLWWRG